MWARSELRARWRSWLVLGILAGATVGIAAAGVAGARRTENVVPQYIAASGRLDAAVLANDPTFDAQPRAAIAALPEVQRSLPFSVPFLLETTRPRELGSPLLPRSPATARFSEPVILEGRHTDPNNPHEAVIDENVADRYGLGIGSTIDVRQDVPPPGQEGQLPPGLIPPGAKSFTDSLRVVGINKAVSSEVNWSPSSAFARAHERDIVGPTNLFIQLRNGDADFLRFQRHVQDIVGHPVNVERGPELNGIPKTIALTGVERDGLLLFALAVLLGGGVLVGQALVRAVNAGGAELETWRAMGADRALAVRGMTLPALLTVAVGAITAVAVAILLSPRFPIGVARRYDLDLGVHTDVLVLVGAVAVLALAVIGITVTAAWWRVTRGEAAGTTTSRTARLVTTVGLPPSMLIGSRLAVEPGRGRRAVPVRSALIGAIVGVLGVTACFTFRSGIADAAANPTRSGIVWDYSVAAGPAPIARGDRATITDDRDVQASARALWARAVPINGVPASAFGIESLRGKVDLVVLTGHEPRNASQIVFAPATLASLRLRVGDDVQVGDPPRTRTMRVVGTALLPSTSHTGYDQSAWMTLAALHSVLGPDAVAQRPDDFEDYLLLRWQRGTDVAAAQRRIARIGGPHGYFAEAPTLPASVVELGNLRTMPMVLAIFFAILACATVAHALVTTVRRRRVDLAVLRSFGFTRRQTRLAVAWQATILAALGLVVGVPLGIVAGRVVWRWVADDFPVVYVPPIEVIAIIVIVPVALLVAQLLAAGPAHAATRIRPAETLRAE